MARFHVRMEETPADFHVYMEDEQSFKMKLGESIDVETFKGEYEYTPTKSKQIVPIKGKTATDDVVINPIPSCYGLITFDGSVLTVS